MSESDAVRALREGVSAWTAFRDQWNGDGVIDCSGVVMLDGALDGCDLSDVSFAGARFERMTLRGATMRFAGLRGAHFIDCDLSGACADGADLTSARIIESRLRATSLLWASLVSACFDRADLTAAHIFGAILGRTVLLESTLEAVRAFNPLHLGRSRMDLATLQTVRVSASEGLLDGFGVPADVRAVCQNGVARPFRIGSCALWRHGVRSGDLAPLERRLTDLGFELSVVDSETIRLDDPATRVWSAALGASSMERAKASAVRAFLSESRNVVLAVAATTVDSPWLHMMLVGLLEDVVRTKRHPPLLLLEGGPELREALVASIAGKSPNLASALTDCPWITLECHGADASTSLIAASEAIRSHCD